jgi:hypothetical protein
MISWERGCQTPWGINAGFNTTYAHLAKTTVALAYHNNTMATARPHQVRNSLEIQWLIYAFNWTWMYCEHFAYQEHRRPIQRLHLEEGTLIKHLTILDPKDLPFVEAILNINFNRRPPNDELIPQTREWYQDHLTAPCSTSALTTINIVIQDHETVTEDDLLTFIRTIRPYTDYARFMETTIVGTTIEIDLEMEDTKENLRIIKGTVGNMTVAEEYSDISTEWEDCDCDCEDCRQADEETLKETLNKLRTIVIEEGKEFPVDCHQKVGAVGAVE